MVLVTESIPNRGNRRIRALMLGGSWRNSWRNSNQTLESRDESNKKGEDELRRRRVKRVNFPRLVEQLVIEIEEDAEPIILEDVKKCWYQRDDYARFEKDRILTSFGYMTSRRAGGSNFDGNKHSIRGLESLIDGRFNKREIGEKKALMKGIKFEEQRQKEEDTFPDLNKFRPLSLKYTKGSRDRAISIAQEDARRIRPRTKSLVVEALYNRSSLPRLRRKSSGSPVEWVRQCGVSPLGE